MWIRNVLLTWGKGDACIRYANRSYGALGFVGKHATYFMLWRSNPCSCFGKRIWKNAVMYDYQNKYSGRFQLLKQWVKTMSITHLFCLPLNRSFQGNCRYGLFAPSPLNFMKAFQSVNYKTNISKTETIYHLVRDTWDSPSLFLKYNVQRIENRITKELRYEVPLYLCLYKSETSCFSSSVSPYPKKQRLYIYGRKAWSSLVKVT